ncbi:MAG TPA: hypothetical protein VFV14_07495, partial [Myxococcaceae bacterium]|nr:hypothetical protein [Myxococcaceae bacterium]
NDAYIEPARARPNLTIAGGATVDRIEIHNGRAFAVRVVIDGVVQTIESRLCLVSSGERSDCSKSKRVFVRP